MAESFCSHFCAAQANVTWLLVICVFLENGRISERYRPCVLREIRVPQRSRLRWSAVTSRRYFFVQFLILLNSDGFALLYMSCRRLLKAVMAALPPGFRTALVCKRICVLLTGP